LLINSGTTQLTVSTGIAKPIPASAPEGLKIAVLTPISLLGSYPDDLRIPDALILQRDLGRVGSLKNVIVGDDPPLCVPNESRTRAGIRERTRPELL